MEWHDDGLIIGLKKHGETSLILEAMTPAHGRHLGLVRGGRSKRWQPLLQPGNSVALVWRARLDEHLGLYAVEVVKPRAANLMASALALHGLNHLATLLRLLAERDPHPALYETASTIADHLSETRTAAALVRFELAILAELGFGLDLASCAATGTREDLIYVSPKSGRAVSRGSGAPYHERLLPLPGFLGDESVEVGSVAVAEAFRLTGYFLERDVFQPRGLPMPQARRAYLTELAKLK
ncbi:MAG: DNA repair protein RecO [Methylovirgula sp.]|uniref:DNA repair protein RecO n=1 Tax=Methylovirgula sp. TaxID=1978224 RepID=UPI0030761FD7